MLTASVPISNEAQPWSDRSTQAVATVLDAAPTESNVLPCRRDPDLWFAESPRDLEQAKALCADCPVKAACLAGAMSRGEPWGVWGGEIFDRGSVIERKRPRGRPRKHPAPVQERTSNGQGEAA